MILQDQKSIYLFLFSFLKSRIFIKFETCPTALHFLKEGSEVVFHD